MGGHTGFLSCTIGCAEDEASDAIASVISSMSVAWEADDADDADWFAELEFIA